MKLPGFLKTVSSPGDRQVMTLPIRRFPSRARACLLALVALGAADPASAFQQVHVLPAGSSGSALQNVIDAAADGDTLLVRGHHGPIHIDGKGLTLVSEGTLWVSFESLTISNTSVGQNVTIAGLTTTTPVSQGTASYPPGIVIDHCAGSVRLQDMSCADQSSIAFPILTVVDSRDVVLMNVALSGGGLGSGPAALSAPQNGQEALRVIRSRVALYDSSIFGGSGRNGSMLDACGNTIPIPAGPPGAGVTLDAQSLLFAARTVFSGGRSNDGVAGRCDCLTGAPIPGTNSLDGGVAIQNAPGAGVFLTGCSPLGGNPGAGGVAASCTGGPAAAGSPGVIGPLTTNPVQVLPLADVSWMGGSRVVRAGQMITVQLQGLPNEPVQLGISTETQFAPQLAFQGVLMIGPSGRRTLLDTLPPSFGGTYTVHIPASLTVPGAQAEQWHFQAFTFGASGFQVGPVRDVTILDPAF